MAPTACKISVTNVSIKMYFYLLIIIWYARIEVVLNLWVMHFICNFCWYDDMQRWQIFSPSCTCITGRRLFLRLTDPCDKKCLILYGRPNAASIGKAIDNMAAYRQCITTNYIYTLEIQYIAVRYFAISSISRIVRGPQIYHDHKKKNK